MSLFNCPICGEVLDKREKSYACVNNHSFDIARSGYVNLLMSQKIKDKQHGDDKLMVRARRDFLEKGYYNSLREAISHVVCKYIPSNGTLLDAGCGECFYTSYINEKLSSLGKNANVIGIDISKNALEIANKRGVDIGRAVASIFKIPCLDASCDMLINIFAPCSEEEFARVLKHDGIMIKVVPLEKHLWTLKKCVYDKPFENPPVETQLVGYEFLEMRQIQSKINLSSNEDIINLFMMTPYYYRTSESDFNKLKNISQLETEIEFGILVYKKGCS